MANFHRNPNSVAASLGKCTEPVKTTLPEDVKLDFERVARDSGYSSPSELLREMILTVTYGEDMVRSLYERRLSVLKVIGPEKDQQA